MCIQDVYVIRTLSIHKKMKWLLKSQFDQNHDLINHTFNVDFKNNLTFFMET
jgi:hypothetical protein